MLSKLLFVSLAFAAASVHADLWISTPSELKQVSFLSFLVSPVFYCLSLADTPFRHLPNLPLLTPKSLSLTV